MARRLARYPGAVDRAADLGEALAFDLRLVAPRLPDFPMPGAFRNEMEYLRHLVLEGAREVYPGEGPGAISPAALARLEHELAVIGDLGFPGYFLVVWDIVRFARGQGIYCQIRGSGADSAVCRCLGVARVDPIRLGLPFERFLSAERGRPPDIDVDFEAEPAARGGHPVLLPALRAGAGGHGGQRHHLPGPLGAPGRGQGLWPHPGPR